jgi:hypothetical protein
LGEKEEGSQKQMKMKEVFPPNPYRYNLRGSSLQFPSSLSPIDESVQHEEIEKRVASLEKVSTACVETVSEGVNSYWLMSKDLEKRVKDINQRVENPD